MRKTEVHGVSVLVIPQVEEVADHQDMFSHARSINHLDDALNKVQSDGILRRDLGSRQGWRFCKSGVLLRIIQTTKEAWHTMLFQSSAGRDLQITVATAAKNLGLRWSPEAGGFTCISDGRLTHPVNDEGLIFEISHVPFIEPTLRHNSPVYPDSSSGRQLPMTPGEVGAWVKSAVWVDTRCGGELHQYSFRRAGSPDEMEFLRVCEMIGEYGYDGIYLGRKWRYLDYEDYFYFTCGSELNVTQLINRKQLRQSSTPWLKNPVRWKYVAGGVSNMRVLMKVAKWARAVAVPKLRHFLLSNQRLTCALVN